MLNGIAPLFIFNFYKALPQLDVSGVPVVSLFFDKIPLVPIPIYLDEKLTGIFIQNEDKHTDCETVIQPKIDGSAGEVTQRGINSSVTIQMLARTDSAIVSILIAMADIIFDKLVKQEYSVTYINKSITVFGGLLQNFSVVQNKNNNLYEISITVAKTTTSTLLKAVAPTIHNTTSASLTDAPRP